VRRASLARKRSPRMRRVMRRDFIGAGRAQ
jgi:hypothetical protein